MVISKNDRLDYERTEAEPEDEETPAPSFEIFSYPADTTLKGYLQQWENKQLTIPDFQRDYVWDQTRASKLIESFLLGLPVPPVFLYKPSNAKEFWIIDGQQRIQSIVKFQKGNFGESKFRLKGVDKRWLGKTFEELSEADRFNLETSVLRGIIIQQTSPADHTSIYHIFERLNTGGIRLNAMEVRMCVYFSKFLKKIKEESNGNIYWHKILGIKNSDKRLKDCELLLRVISLYQDVENYEKPMKSFLNNCSIRYCLAEKMDDEDIILEGDNALLTFREVCQEIIESLGEKPFHLRGRLNFSALDVTFAVLMRNRNVSDLSEKFNMLKQNQDFLSSVSYDTSDEKVVKKRFDIASMILV